MTDIKLFYEPEGVDAPQIPDEDDLDHLLGISPPCPPWYSLRWQRRQRKGVYELLSSSIHDFFCSLGRKEGGIVLPFICLCGRLAATAVELAPF